MLRNVSFCVCACVCVAFCSRACGLSAQPQFLPGSRADLVKLNQSFAELCLPSQQYWDGFSIFLVTLCTLTPRCKTCLHVCALLGVCLCVLSCCLQLPLTGLLAANGSSWKNGIECFKEESVSKLTIRPRKQNAGRYSFNRLPSFLDPSPDFTLPRVLPSGKHLISALMSCWLAVELQSCSLPPRRFLVQKW